MFALVILTAPTERATRYKQGTSYKLRCARTKIVSVPDDDSTYFLVHLDFSVAVGCRLAPYICKTQLLSQQIISMVQVPYHATVLSEGIGVISKLMVCSPLFAS
jgi:hypothetical protein